MTKTRKYIRTTAYIYMTAICIMWLSDNFSAGYTNWVMLSLTALIVIAAFLRKPVLDKVAGYITMIGGAYMMLAVLSAYNRAMSNHHPDAANKALAFGLPMFALTAVAGVLLFWLALSATEQQPAAQQTL